MPKVYFTKKYDADSIKRLATIVLSDTPTLKDNIAIKVHFGEEGNTNYVKPDQIKPILEILKRRSTDMFLTDTNTLYVGMRSNAKDHIQIAAKHGFDKLSIPIIISDGEIGDDYRNIEINKNIFKTVKIGKAIALADSIVFISHFKGHMLFGFGGAIKNAGMGCASRAGKLEMHSKIKPSVSSSICTGCKLCISNCLSKAIALINNKAYIDQSKCTGCARCIAVCKSEAISVPWGGATSLEAQERCAEYAFGAVKNKKCIYINFIQNISKDCDCMENSEIIGKDIGIVASIDPVSIDKASYDLVIKEHKKDIFQEHNKVNGAHILDYSRRIGLGNIEYELVEI